MTDHRIPTMMRAAVLERAGVVSIESRRVPRPAPDEVLVKVTAVGVCGSDTHYFREGRIGEFVVDHPLVLGHEAAGVIVDVGRHISPDRVGQRVSVEPQVPCRACDQCMAGRYNLCPHIRFFATPPVDGAFQEFVTVPSVFAFDLPDSISDEEGALFEPLSVGIWTAQKARIRPGSRVLIAGAGPIGSICAQTARAFGAAEVIVSDPDGARRELVLGSGATRTLDPREESVDGLEVDAFIDASGSTMAVQAGLRSVRGAGFVVLVGMGQDEIALPIPTIQNRELTVTGIFRYANTWPTARHLVESGAVDLASLVTAHFGLDQVAEALGADRVPGSMKVIVHPDR